MIDVWKKTQRRIHDYTQIPDRCHWGDLHPAEGNRWVVELFQTACSSTAHMPAVDQMNSCRCWPLLTQLTVGAVKSAGRQWRESLGISGGTLSSKATSRCLPPLTIDCQLCSPASDLADLLMETQNPNFSLRFIAKLMCANSMLSLKWQIDRL